MHLAGLTVIRRAGRRPSVLINADLGSFAGGNCRPGRRSFSACMIVFVTPSCAHLLWVLRAVTLSPLLSLIVRNVQLHAMRQSHNVVSLLIHWWTLSP